MKYIGLKLILILAFLTLLNSCKEESSTNNDNDTTDPQILAISAKWNVSDNNSTYVAFEFNKYGNYIVSFDEYLDEEPRFGKYELVGGTTIKMAGFGEILIVSVNENSFEFELTTYEDNYTESIRTLKQEEMELTTRTKLLCRTWELKEIIPEKYSDYEEWEIDLMNSDNLTVLFSPAGTYFVRSSDKGEDYFYNKVSIWKWFDNSEKILCYSHYNNLDCNPSDQVTIPVLNSNYLEIREKGLIFKLVPFTGKYTTSMNFNELENNNKNNKTRTSKFPKGSFFFGK